MSSVRINKKQTKMVAHRGLSGIETENSLPSFRRAAGASYFGIETDVHVTKDGYFVAFHDDSTERMAKDGKNFVIENTELEKLKTVRFNDKSGLNGENELYIPLLEEYIAVCRDAGKKSVLELKNRFEEKDIVRLVKLIGKLGHLSNMIFISFSDFNCVTLRKLLPDAEIQFLTVNKVDEKLIDFLKKEKLDLDIEYKRLGENEIKLLRENGIKVNCWTLDDPDIAEKLAGYGIDYITSNILE